MVIGREPKGSKLCNFPNALKILDSNLISLFIRLVYNPLHFLGDFRSQTVNVL